ncbi:MAG TPA: DUF222 domain-containing protein [Jatrophihabitantaceae bacterium]
MFEREAPQATLSDVLDSPDAVVAELARVRPAPEDAVTLSLLDPGSLSAAGRVDLLVALERQAAWIAAQQQRVLARMAVEQADDRNWVREDVACALRMSGRTAARRLAVAQTLAERLPATLKLLDRGEVGYLHAAFLAQAVFALDAKQARAVEEQVLPRAVEQTLSEFQRSVRQAVARVAAATVEEQRAEAMKERRVCLTPRDDGMTELWALLPAEGAAAVVTAVDALASVTSADDPRTPDQRRADALVDLGVAALHDPLLPKAQGMRPSIQITVALSTLLGTDEQPGELAGHGPIPASVARRLAADESGTWRRLVTDPVTGQLLDYGQDTYRPPKDLAEFVIARDQTCTFPGCERPARRCDLDHQTPYRKGGSTSSENMGPLCERHHIGKHEAGWTPHRHEDGTTTWISPTKHVYRSRPPDLPHDTTTDPPPF